MRKDSETIPLKLYQRFKKGEKEIYNLYPDITPSLSHIALNVLASSPV